MSKRKPQQGDIWNDGNGPFLVLEKHTLAPHNKRLGYVYQMTILDLSDGSFTHNWKINSRQFNEMTFVA